MKTLTGGASRAGPPEVMATGKLVGLLGGAGAAPPPRKLRFRGSPTQHSLRELARGGQGPACPTARGPFGCGRQAALWIRVARYSMPILCPVQISAHSRHTGRWLRSRSQRKPRTLLLWPNAAPR